MLYKNFNKNAALSFNTRTIDTEIAKGLVTAFAIDKVDIFSISRNHQSAFELMVAHYQDHEKQLRQATIFPKTKTTQLSLNIDSQRGQAWNSAAQAINQHSDDNTLFLTWWDNAQRLHLMTGRKVWAHAPSAAAFQKQDERQLWREIGGGFEPENKRLKQLANWLVMDADQALIQIKKALTPDQQAYFLVTVEDLARLKEIANLSEQPLPFQTRVFATTDNMHTQISQVKTWAQQDSTGSYMVHSIPGVGVRAWRIKGSVTENSLLARLLPFSHALEKPLDGIDLVYRSEHGGYLSIYRLNN